MKTNPKVFDVCNSNSLLVTLDSQMLMCLQYDSRAADVFLVSSPQLGTAYTRQVVKTLILFVPLTPCLLERYTTSLLLTVFKAKALTKLCVSF